MRTLIVLLSVLCVPASLNVTFAQTPQTAVEYMEYLSSRSNNLADKYMSYMAAVAHSRRAKKMEKRRSELIAEIRKNLGEVTRLKPFQGDATLRDAYKKYWDLELKVFNEDYHKIVDMEEIAEQSYDAMEAYMTAQQQAAKVLQSAHGEVRLVFSDFANRNKITLVDTESKVNSKLDKTGEVTDYFNKIYLIYFKSYKQEAYLLDAINKNDVNGAEQNRLTLIKYAEEGLAKLDTIKPYGHDASLTTSLRRILNFYIKEAQQGIVKQIDFMIKRAEFDKLQKSMETTPANKRTQADIDTYNKAVTKFNATVNATNVASNADNTARKKLLDDHQEAERKFLDTHVPK
ncbi:LIC11966 family surface protein [Pseudochryseolinea flava]|uniref:Uncharacterized protein n=1 Tax=Pseudochryseolinea flava TaxID=2059302 RepID=A0A364Y1E9_9BACT|nr:hypothetical protein [Pseudochryseolinea flava]RAW00558.1 hypothetical protein DQQ10_13240 [Pseudochryseolinea flava]